MRYAPDGDLEVEENDICYNCRYIPLERCPMMEMIKEGLLILAVPKGHSITHYECEMYQPMLKGV